ncbi:MAG: uncharacterized protein JWM87_4443 [Candidatus Eremiobacteraeota bacterium]|nr:uncharacterized protein [Candidatus Eremiobacteraeota bacterium]
MSPLGRVLFQERCQFENSIYRYVPPLDDVRAVRRAVKRLPDRYAARAGEGRPSRFAAGDWVRVRDAGAIRATLDARDALRGLVFTPVQWSACGKTYRVDAVVRRMMTDAGRMRAISRTVTLDGVSCDGPDRNGGCGRSCALLFRDEWLEPSSPELAAPQTHAQFARVKPLATIVATLDGDGRRHGVMFAPAMAQYAGGRFPVHKRVDPIAANPWRRAYGEWYILAGVRCLGEVLNGDGPCHRGCGLLWHRDWLDFE